MKWTPQKAITSAVGGLGVIGEAERIPDVVGDILDVAGLIVMGEDDGVSGLLEGQDFLLEVERGMALGDIGWERMRQVRAAGWAR